jgi:hypothetical protein
LRPVDFLRPEDVRADVFWLDDVREADFLVALFFVFVAVLRDDFLEAVFRPDDFLVEARFFVARFVVDFLRVPDDAARCGRWPFSPCSFMTVRAATSSARLP